MDKPINRVPRSLVALALMTVVIGEFATAEQPAGSVFGTVTILDRNGIELMDRSNVVVFLEGATSTEDVETDEVSISQKNQRFSPQVVPILAGSAVNFLNDDAIYHNVFSLSKTKTFDLGIYAQGSSKLVAFEEPGLVRVYCNIHPDMVSTILVLNNHFFDVTADNGRYEINDVPTGDFTLRMWSEFGEEISVPVAVTASGTEYSVVLNQTKGLAPHNNKFGKPYRKKY